MRMSRLSFALLFLASLFASYPILVTGVSGGITHSGTITLTVN